MPDPRSGFGLGSGRGECVGERRVCFGPVGGPEPAVKRLATNARLACGGGAWTTHGALGATWWSTAGTAERTALSIISRYRWWQRKRRGELSWCSIQRAASATASAATSVGVEGRAAGL